jgi:hypothetical protein
MDNTISTIIPNDSEDAEYSIDNEIKDIIRQPLVDILVALMLINDIFLYLNRTL